MYHLTLKTRGELDDDQFQEVFSILDSRFVITKVLTFDEEGNKIYTIAVMDEHEDGCEYEFDVSRRIEVAEGDELMLQLEEILVDDFELDAPISKENYNEDQ